MNHRTLRRLLGGWAIFLVVLLVGIQWWSGLSPLKNKVVVTSTWKQGVRVSRTVGTLENPPVDVDVAVEEITADSPIIMSWLFFDLGLVPGLDGVSATLNGQTVYATVDDLMNAQAYDRGHLWVEASFGWGVIQPAILDILASQMKMAPQELWAKAKFRRIRMTRLPYTPSRARNVAAMRPRPDHIESKDLTRELVTDGLHEAALHLARDVDGQGRFRYMIDAPSNHNLGGYNWPRHAGATFFLAQAAKITNDGFVRWAALRAGGRLRDEMLRPCGDHKCITEDQPIAEIGSSALALIAFTEIVRTGADTTYKPVINDLAAFLRSQQRPDGELMHLYDRVAKQPIDKQFLYYSGEATLGLARAHAVNGNPEDLEAAKRALSRISGSGWSFFGSRYYFSEEHWTCQAVSELWERAPDRDALAFCARWHEYQRRLQYSPDDSPFDADGAFGFGPIVSPRVTPASSRGEAAGALLDVYLRDHGADHMREMPLVDNELRHALAFVLRNQLHPGPAYLFADPVAVRGALPGSPVDWQLRIDYAQHAGSMMARWLEVDALQHPAAPPLHSAQ